jgi:hypothetical protein
MSPRFAWMLPLIATLAACGRPYLRPEFDPPDTQFKGVASYLKDASAVQVVFVHGMCTHEKKHWVDEAWDPQIARSLGAVIGRQADARSTQLSPRAKYTIVPRSYNVGSKQLHARFVLWSESTTPAKNKLSFDNPPPAGEFKWQRASLNAEIKAGLVNDCLSDAMIYAGESGPELREMMKYALCEAVDLVYDPQTKNCQETVPARTPGGPILIVTESLGSKMVIDASLELAGGTAPAAFERRLAFVPQVYMLANQLPLIELAHPAQQRVQLSDRSLLPVAESAERFAALLVASRRAHGIIGTPKRSLRAAEDEVSIVAFTDPNDLLSYRLPLSNPGDPYSVSNVLVSNASTLLGKIENPMAAHTGYRSNDAVMKLILCGTDAADCEALTRGSGP